MTASHPADGETLLDMTTIVHGGLCDVIACSWYQLGFRPRESALVIGLEGVPPRTGVVARVDLPLRDDPDALAAEGGWWSVGVLRSTLAAPLRRTGASAVIVLVVTDHEHAHAADLAGPVVAALGVERLRIVEVLHVGPVSFRSVWQAAGEGQDPLDTPLACVETSAVAAHMVAAGRVLHPCEEELLRDVDPVQGYGATSHLRGERVPLPGASSDSPSVRVDPADGAGGDGAEAGRAHEGRSVGEEERGALWWWGRWQEMLAGGPVEAHDAVGLAVALRDVRLRDAAMVSLVPGAGAVADEILAGGDPADWSLMGGRPEPGLLDRGREILAAAARQAPPGERAEALAVLGWAAWWSGDGARARLLVGRALHDRSNHRLSLLVDGLLREGVPPPWAAREGAPAGPTDCAEGKADLS